MQLICVPLYLFFVRFFFICKFSHSIEANIMYCYSLSQTFTILATIHHDSSLFELDSKIRVHRDGKEKIKHQYGVSRCSSVSPRFIYGSPTTHDGSATIHLGGATNVHDASTIRYGASTIQASSTTTSFSYCIRDESGWIGINRGVSDIWIHPECPRMTTNTPTVPLRTSPIPLR